MQETRLMTITKKDLDSFHKFAAERLDHSSADSTLEELVSQWKTSREYAETVEDIQQGVDDYAAGAGRRGNVCVRGRGQATARGTEAQNLKQVRRCTGARSSFGFSTSSHSFTFFGCSTYTRIGPRAQSWSLSARKSRHRISALRNSGLNSFENAASQYPLPVPFVGKSRERAGPSYRSGTPRWRCSSASK